MLSDRVPIDDRLRIQRLRGVIIRRGDGTPVVDETTGDCGKKPGLFPVPIAELQDDLHA